MSTVTVDVEGAANAVRQHSFILEGAVHRPNSWSTVVDNVRMPVYVESSIDGDEMTALFVSGPIQAGEHYVSLEMEGVPVFGRVEIFTECSCWVHTIRAKISR